jgi:hypothetical protein
MLIANAIRKLQRAGFIVCEGERGVAAKRPGARRIVEMSRNGGDSRDRVATIKVRGVNDHDDVLTDYFAGSYVNSVAQAIRWAQ